MFNKKQINNSNYQINNNNSEINNKEINNYKYPNQNIEKII